MSNFFNLNLKDAIKGVITAVLAAILTLIYGLLQSGNPIDLHQILLVGLTAGLGYIIKNFLTDSNGNFVGKV